VTRRDADAGSATVLVLAASLVVVAAAALVTSLAAATLTRHRALAAADAAALAAAAADLGGPGSACAAAGDAARTDGGRLRGCRLVDGVATVVVAVPAPGWLAWMGPAAARARAGRVLAYQQQPG
jgi:secretion/DNA translocation related TadE-like protein